MFLNLNRRFFFSFADGTAPSDRLAARPVVANLLKWSFELERAAVSLIALARNADAVGGSGVASVSSTDACGAVGVAWDSM